MQDGSDNLDFRQVLEVFRRRVALIALCVAVVAGAAFLFSKHQTKQYTATASMIFNQSSLSQEIAGLSSGGGASSSSLLAQQANNLELVKSGDVATRTASLVGRGLTEQKVASSVSVSGQGESGVIDVSVTSASPLLAATIANTYTTEFVREQQNANHKYFKSALAVIHKQLMALSPQQRNGADGLPLQARAQTLNLLAELNYGTVQVAQKALAPSSPSSPKTSRNTALGLFLGLVLGLGLALVLERFDRRIRRPQELETIYRLPTLGAVPKSAAFRLPARGKHGRQTALPPADAEVFSLIRAHLRFLKVDRPLRTIVIGSAGQGEGRSTIAQHLAETASRLGARVLLLEADLRRPTLAQHLDIQPGPGLAQVLTGVVRVEEATQSIEFESDGMGTSRALDILVAGDMLPPNPVELLESHAMDAVLQQAKSSYDLVVIDTPPLMIVSDAFPLLSKVDGVIIVGRVGHTQRDAADQLHQILAGSGANLLGVTVNGVSRRKGSSNLYPNIVGDKRPPARSDSTNGASPTDGVLPPARV